MSKVSVHEKEPDHFNELLILDLHAPYVIVHQKDDKAMLDIHIKRKEAKILLKGLQDILVDGDANQS